MGFADLAERDGWHVEEYAARVHYDGAGDRYSVEYYEPSECVLYWKVNSESGVAVPVHRETVPQPLRDRIKLDFEAVGIDPVVEAQVV